jgi:hypothetical protein
VNYQLHSQIVIKHFQNLILFKFELPLIFHDIFEVSLNLLHEGFRHLFPSHVLLNLGQFIPIDKYQRCKCLLKVLNYGVVFIEKGTHDSDNI